MPCSTFPPRAALASSQTPDDVRFIRKVLNEAGGHQVKIISKIENEAGLEHFDLILQVRGPSHPPCALVGARCQDGGNRPRHESA